VIAIFRRYNQVMQDGLEARAADVGLLWLRLYAGGVMLIAHGWAKLFNFGERMHTFSDPLGIGSPASLALATFAEFFCAIFIMLGIGTRLACTQLIATMAIAVMVSGGNIFGGRESAEFPFMFLGAYIALFLIGPGRISFDHKIRQKFLQ